MTAPPRPLTAGAALTAASQVAVALTGSLTTIVVARALGPAGAGGWAVAQTILLLLMVATTLGVEHGIVYFVSSGRWDPRAAYRSALGLALVAGSCGAALVLGVRLLVPDAFASLSWQLTAVVVAALPFALAWFYGSYCALATDRYEAFALPPAAQSALVLVFAVPGAVVFGLRGVVVGLAGSSVLVGVAMVLWAKRRLAGTSVPAQPRQLRRAIGFGIKGYGSNALQLLNYRLDLFILAAVASSATVGRYSVAVAVTSVVWLLPNSLSNVVFPRVAQLDARGDRTQRDLVEAKSLRHASLLAGSGAIALAVVLELLVVPVFGSDFRPSVGLGLILLPGAVFVGVSTVLTSIIAGHGKPIYPLYVALLVTPLTIALYATLIPLLHASGAALASTVSYATTFLLLCWFFRRMTGRQALPLLLPTRAEVDDLRALPRTVSSWAAGLRA